MGDALLGSVPNYLAFGLEPVDSEEPVVLGG